MAREAVLGNVDLVRHLLAFADVRTVVAARKTCAIFRTAATDEVLRKVGHWRDLPRDLHPRLPPPTCIGCKATTKGVPWEDFQLYCSSCRCVTFLPPPAPRVARFSRRHTHYFLPKTTAVFFVQIQPHNDDEWRTVCATTRNMLCCPRACRPMRLAARTEKCKCGAADPIECFHVGTCTWTPWSEATRGA